MPRITLDLSSLFDERAKLSELEGYVKKASDIAGRGNEIILTGSAPVWLYLKILHALHGIARKLIYDSPVTGEIVIFDHSPYDE